MKVIDYKEVSMTEQEYAYYKELVSEFTDQYNKGEDFFRDLFDTDKEGYITIITPKKSIPWAILWFVQNLMINQRMRLVDKHLRNKG